MPYGGIIDKGRTYNMEYQGLHFHLLGGRQAITRPGGRQLSIHRLREADCGRVSILTVALWKGSTQPNPLVKAGLGWGKGWCHLGRGVQGQIKGHESDQSHLEHSEDQVELQGYSRAADVNPQHYG